MMSDEDTLAAAEALDRCYAEADAFDAAHAPMLTVYRVNWDNGADACGTFPETYPTEVRKPSKPPSISKCKISLKACGARRAAAR